MLLRAGLFHEADLSHRLRPVLRFYRPLVVRAGLQALNQPGRFQAMCDHVPRVGFCPENRIALGQRCFVDDALRRLGELVAAVPLLYPIADLTGCAKSPKNAC
jgi:hypothetical protein